MSVKNLLKLKEIKWFYEFLTQYKMGSDSICDYNAKIPSLSRVPLFFSVLSFSSAGICTKCTKKQDLPHRADPVLFKNRVSAEIFPFQIPHHPHIAGLAALVSSGQQILIAGREIFLADARIARVTV